MNAHLSANDRQKNVWLDKDAGEFQSFRQEVEREASTKEYPNAEHIEKNIPVYCGHEIKKAAVASDKIFELLTEFNRIFDSGPGIIVIRGGIRDHSIIDAATLVFEGIIEKERDEETGGGDHFAKPGANDRVWNAAEKHCLADPQNFAAYYACDGIALAARAWLGRGYQLTAQVNRVNPGGEAQTAHRDYHLGFMNADQLATYPVQAHRFSPNLTLQGAVVHCDMPIESGPTMLLPYSQRFLEGYVAYGRPEFQAYFAENYVQLPLEKGDLLFFSPAVMHGAGTNKSGDIQRMANLLQIGSAFGRSIESVNRSAMVKTLYPVLADGSFSPRAQANVIAASAEGYAFPTNLDLDPPVNGLIPLSQAELMEQALERGDSALDWNAAVAAMDSRRQP